MKYSYKAILTLLVLGLAIGPVLGQAAKSAPRSKLFDSAQLLRDIETLSSDEFEGRSPARASMQKARDLVRRRFTEAGLKPIGNSFEQPFEIKRRGNESPLKGVNYIGLIRGSKYPDKYIAVTAHYDHEGIQNGQIFNGADDNASGTAALFAMATYFNEHKPDHSLIFVAFDAEEMGLLGSRYFVSNLPVPKESVQLNINMDMISRSDKGELYAAGATYYPQLRPALEAAQKKAAVKLVLGHDDPKSGKDNWTSQSDQAAFHAAKIPFIYFGVEDHADYHKPTDDFANIQPSFYVRSVETILESLRIFDGSVLQ